MRVADFHCTGQQVRDMLANAVRDSERKFAEDTSAPDARTRLEAAAQTFDPTPRETYQIVTGWARRRYH